MIAPEHRVLVDVPATTQWRIRIDVLATILRGEAHLFGKRIALAWPDGLPDGMTEDDVKRLVSTEEHAHEDLLDAIRKLVRTHGQGDVQKAFGRFA